MADVVDSFLRGRATAQAESEHEQALQDSKLRQMVLKHQISEFKVNDALRANELQRKFADMQLGQGGQDQPSPGAAGDAGAPVQPPDPAAVAPARAFGPFASGYAMPAAADMAPAPPPSIADVIQGQIRQRLGGVAAEPPATPTPTPGPAVHQQVVNPAGTVLNLHSSEAVPADHQPVGAAGPAAAGARTLGTPTDAEMRAAGHVYLPPISIPELGVNVAGMWYSARLAREEEAARAIALKRAEQPLVNTKPGDVIYDPFTKKETFRNNNPKTDAPLSQQYDDAMARGDRAAADRILASINATREHPPNDEYTQNYLPTVAASLGKTVDQMSPAERMKAFRDYKTDPSVQASRADAAAQRLDTAQQGRLDRSYQFNSTQLEKIRTPLTTKADKLATAADNLSQRTPSADALVAPEILSVMAGGQGSGLRMNEAEIQRIVGGRSNWESIKAAANKWRLDPTKALSITDAQRLQLGQLLEAGQARLHAKLDAVDQANQDLVSATDVSGHRAALDTVQRRLGAIDRGGPNLPSTTTPSRGFTQVKQPNGQIVVTAPDGSLGYFATQSAADKAIKAMGGAR